MSPRRLSDGLGDSFPSLSLAGVAMAALLFFGACSSDGSVASTTTSTAASPATTSAETSPTTTKPVTTTTTTTTLPPVEDVMDSWGAFWDAWVEVRASVDLDPAPLDAVAASDVVEGAVSLFERERSSGDAAVETDVLLHAKVTDLGPDAASVEDCVLLSPSFTDTVGVWYEADLSRTEQGWIVDEIRIPSGSGCVPQEMADAAVAAYEGFYEGWIEYWDPADPESPLLDQLLADPQKTLIVDLLADHQARGVALRGSPNLHPEVIEVRSSTELVILNCLEPASDYGVYDIESGERLDDVPAPRSGQRNLESAVMVLEDGSWKVSDLQGQVDFACEFAPTERGLPSV